jgi:hypothetical protein
MCFRAMSRFSVRLHPSPTHCHLQGYRTIAWRVSRCRLQYYDFDSIPEEFAQKIAVLTRRVMGAQQTGGATCPWGRLETCW